MEMKGGSGGGRPRGDRTSLIGRLGPRLTQPLPSTSPSPVNLVCQCGKAMTGAPVCKPGAAASSCLPFSSFPPSSFFLFSSRRSFEVPPTVQTSPSARGRLRPPAQPRWGLFVADRPCWSLPTPPPPHHHLPPGRCLSSTSFQLESALLHSTGSVAARQSASSSLKCRRRRGRSVFLDVSSPAFKALGGAPHAYKYACGQTTRVPCKFTGRPKPPDLWTSSPSAHVEEVFGFRVVSTL